MAPVVSQDVALADLRVLTKLTCQGRALVDGPGESIGDICAATFTWRWRGPLLDAARAAGWRVGHRADGTPDALCPRCGRPDPVTLAHCKDLARSISA